MFLTWEKTGRVVSATGDWQALLGVTELPSTLEELGEILGIASLPHVVDWPSEGPSETARFLRGTKQGQPVTYRASLQRSPEGTVRAEILDLSALLVGAPPVQISALSSSLSHEIRNPLASVKMTVQTLARNTALSERDLRRLTIANREIRTIERMLSLLSEYGRDSAPHLESIPLRNLVQDAAASVEAELQERNATLHIDEEPSLPKVRADPARCRPVVAQLLLNVVSGIDGGGELSIRLERRDGRVRMSVEDKGSTLPEDTQSLFEPFGSRLARGAGLSLAALRRVLVSQGGNVHAEPGKLGTVFALTFVEA